MVSSIGYETQEYLAGSQSPTIGLTLSHLPRPWFSMITSFQEHIHDADGLHHMYFLLYLPAYRQGPTAVRKQVWPLSKTVWIDSLPRQYQRTMLD